jgi:F-type H+-transporting ATPase subunit epsilon
VSEPATKLRFLAELPTSPDLNLRPAASIEGASKRPDDCPLNAANSPQDHPTNPHINTPPSCLLPGNPPVSRTSRQTRPAPRCAARREEPRRGPGANALRSYNRYLTVASRVVRRSLKDDKRLIAERRGESELRFAKWEVRTPGRYMEDSRRDQAGI